MKKRRPLALCLLICFFLTMVLPQGPVRADVLPAPAAEEIHINLTGQTIDISVDTKNAEAMAWLRAVSAVKVNNYAYLKDGEGKEKFEFKEEDGILSLKGNVAILHENTFFFVAKGYENLDATMERDDIENAADGLSISGLNLKTYGDEAESAEGVGIVLEYARQDESEAALGLLIKNELESITLDDYEMPFQSEDNGQVLPNAIIVDSKVLAVFNKYEKGIRFVATYKRAQEHKVTLRFKDRSEVSYETPGYKEPDPGEKPDPGDKPNPGEKPVPPPSKDGLAAIYPLTKAFIVDSYGSKELKLYFGKDIGLDAAFAASQTIEINGQTLLASQFSKDIYTSGAYKLDSIQTEPFVNAKTLNIVVTWKDGSKSTISANVAQAMKDRWRIDAVAWKDEKIVFTLVGDDLAAAEREMRSVRVNDETIDSEDYSYENGQLTINGSASAPFKSADHLDALIIWMDDSQSDKSVTIKKEEDPLAPYSYEDKAKGLTIKGDETSFNVPITTELTWLDQAALLKAAKLKEPLAEGETLIGFDIHFKHNGSNKASDNDLHYSLDLGDRSPKGVKVYKELFGDYMELKGVRVEGKKVLFEKSTGGIIAIRTKAKSADPAKPGAGDAQLLHAMTLVTKEDYLKRKLLVATFSDWSKDNTSVNKEIADLLRSARWEVNGVDTGKPTFIFPSASYDGCEIQTGNTAIYEALKKQDPPSIKLHFDDGSVWSNGVELSGPVDKPEYGLGEQLPDGTYTLTFKATHKGSDQDSMIASFLAPKAKLEVKGGQRTVTFLNTSMAPVLLDFALAPANQWQSGRRTTEGLKPDQAAYAFTLNDLSGRIDGGVLLTVNGGRDSMKGQYGSYTAFDLYFTNTIRKGWTGFVDQDADQQSKEGAANLRAKLIAQGVIPPGSEGIPIEALKKARGTIDLSSADPGPAMNVDILKHLGPGVTELILASNRLSELPEGFFDQMTGLRKIDLSGNQLTRLPANAFAKNPNLAELSLSGNRLQSLDPALLAKATDLKQLDLSENLLTTLPEGFLDKNPKLKSFYMSNAHLASLPDQIFAKNDRLEVVVLGENRLTALPTSLGELSSLKELSLEKNQLTTLPADLGKLRSLSILRAGENQLTEVHESVFLRLARNAQSSPDTRLELQDNRLTTIPFAKMAGQSAPKTRALAAAPARGLAFFDVRGNALNPFPSEAEQETMRATGIRINKDTDTYYPQNSMLGAALTAKAGQLTYHQEADLLETAIWRLTSERGRIPAASLAEYRAAIDQLLDSKKIQRSINRHRDMAPLLQSIGYDWQIRTIITKNNGTVVVDEALAADDGSKQNPIDKDELTFKDPTMQAGDRYSVRHEIFLKKGAMAYRSYAIGRAEAVAEGASPAASQVQTVPLRILQAHADNESMAADVFGKTATLVNTTVDRGGKDVERQVLFVDILNASIMGRDVRLTHFLPSLDAEHINNLPVAIVQKDATGIRRLAFEWPKDGQGKPYRQVVVNIMAEGMPSDQDMRLVLDLDQAKAVETAPNADIAIWKGMDRTTHDLDLALAEARKAKPNAALSKAIKEAEKLLPLMNDDDQLAQKRNAIKALKAAMAPSPAPKAETLDAWLEKTGTGKPSHANGTMRPTIERMEKDGKVLYTVYFKPMTVVKTTAAVQTLTVDGMPAKALTGKADGDYAQVFTFERPDKNDKTLPVRFTFGVGEIHHSADATLHLGEKAPKADPPAPQPAPKEETLDAWLEKTGSGKPSMANQALRQKVDRAFKDGKVVYTVYFKPMQMMGLTAEIAALRVGDAPAALVPGLTDGAYTKAFRFERSTADEKSLPLTFDIANPKMTQSATLHLGSKAPDADHRNLQDAIARAKAKLADGKRYTAASRSNLEKALALAERALALGDKEAEKAALATLNAAMQALRLESGGGSSSDRVEKTLSAYLRHASKNAKSMANDAMDSTVDVVEENGEATYTVYFKDLKVKTADGELVGHIDRLTIDGSDAEAVAGRSGYENGFRFTRPSIGERQIKLDFYFDAMKMEQSAILVLGETGSGLSGSSIGGSTEASDTTDLTKARKALKALIKEVEAALKAHKDLPKEAAKDLDYALIDAKAVVDKDSQEAIEKATKKLKDAMKKAGVEAKTPAKETSKKEAAKGRPGGYIAGYEDASFRPDRKITRAEAVTLLARLLEAEGAKQALPKDIKADAWYANAVAGLAARDILSEKQAFRPDQPLTRAELVALLARAQGWQSQKPRYIDIAATHWAANVIGAAQAQGIVAGYPDGSFRPEQAVSRAEMVTILNRVFHVQAPADITNTFSDVPANHWAANEILKAAN